MNNKQLIEEAQGLCEKASPAPWNATLCEWDCACYPMPKECNKCSRDCGKGEIINGAYVEEIKTVEYGDFCDMNDDDALFVARSRTLIELPCKVGDTVYYIVEGKVKSAELRAIRVHISPNELTEYLFEGYIQHGAYVYCWIIGQMLFLTEPEAQAALSERKE